MDAVDEECVLLQRRCGSRRAARRSTGVHQPPADTGAGVSAVAVGRRRNAALRVEPQQTAADYQQQREHRKLRPADAPLAAVAVVPGRALRRSAGRPPERCVAICLTVAGQAKESLTKPSTCSSTHAPAAYASAHWATLRRRSLAQMLLVFTLCRRVGQSAAPMASECSGLPAGARGKQVHSDLKADPHVAFAPTIDESKGERWVLQRGRSQGHGWRAPKG